MKVHIPDDKPPVTVDLIGGLGNQLFSFAAGLSYAQQQNRELKLRFIQNVFHNKHATHSAFEQLGLLNSHKYELKSQETFSDRVARKLNSKIKGKDYLNFIPKSRAYYAGSIGYEDLSQIGENINLLHGYFQSWRYFESVRDDILRLIDKALPSDEIASELSRKAKAINPIIMHIRLGDYLSPENGYFGALSPKYYASALSQLRDLGLKGPIWVFSDDVEKAEHVYRDSLPDEIEWVRSSSALDSFNALLVMRQASAHVIANSTFSWWGAASSLTSSAVIAPCKWFKENEDPKDLIPPNWIKIKSEWIENVH